MLLIELENKHSENKKRLIEKRLTTMVVDYKFTERTLQET
jgi:hypothetical protein